MENYQIIKARQDAGDELDRLAAEMRDREGIPYTKAFERVSALNSELVNLYLHGVAEGIKRAV